MYESIAGSRATQCWTLQAEASCMCAVALVDRARFVIVSSHDAALLTRAVALQAGHALTQLGLMAHLTGILAKESNSSLPARTAALAAITSLCLHQRQAQLNFFQYGGVSTLLQAMLQEDRCADDETAAALVLFEGVLAPMPECRDIMESVRGMEVLAQVHRDAPDGALRARTVTVLAQLTYRCGVVASAKSAMCLPSFSLNSAGLVMLLAFSDHSENSHALLLGSGVSSWLGGCFEASAQCQHSGRASVGIPKTWRSCAATHSSSATPRFTTRCSRCTSPAKRARGTRAFSR